ncbi:MAG: GNAT family N-acetyltransferase [Polyangiaceae bacterium]|nr:GNAT family N-acetyltransferase [Polyangiaceae bacterium]
MTSLAYRAATLACAEEIAALHAESWRRTYRGIFRDEFLLGDLERERRAVWRARLASPRASTLGLVASDERGVRGFVYAFERGDPGWGVFIDNLHVAASHQRAGVGAALLAAVARWASHVSPGVAPYLWVLEPNVRARQFYERRGASLREATVRENPGGGTATYLRYAWTDPTEMAARTLTACVDLVGTAPPHVRLPPSR